MIILIFISRTVISVDKDIARQLGMFCTGAAFFQHGMANSDSVNSVGSAFLAVPSTTKYVDLSTPISVPCQLLRKCKRSSEPCRGKDQCSVLGTVPIFKPSRQKDKCKRAVPCPKKVAPFQAQTVPETL